MLPQFLEAPIKATARRQQEPRYRGRRSHILLSSRIYPLCGILENVSRTATACVSPVLRRHQRVVFRSMSLPEHATRTHKILVLQTNCLIQQTGSKDGSILSGQVTRGRKSMEMSTLSHNASLYPYILYSVNKVRPELSFSL